MVETKARRLRELLRTARPVVSPGVYDGYSARLVETMGFKTAATTGAGLTNSVIVQPDIGIFGLRDNVDACRHLARSVSIPLTADADTGYGNAVTVYHVVQYFEEAGIVGINVEDQLAPKRCGHLDGKALISTGEMAGKIKAALDTREEALVIARTDAVAVEGLEPALERAERYAEAGADMLFIEALRSVDEMKAANARFKGKVPLMANMVEGGKTPVLSTAELQSIGYSFAIFPGGTVRSIAFGLQEYFASLRKEGGTAKLRDRMLDFNGLNRTIGTPELLQLGKKYDA